MKYSYIPAAAIAVAGVLGGICTPLNAETVSMNPPMVVADNNGAVLGPVIAIATNGRPLVLVADSTEPAGSPRGIILRVEKNVISTEDDFQVFYSDPGCGGTPHLRPASERTGLAEMTDINYSVGLNGLDKVVYKASGSGSSISYQSIFNSNTGSCTDSNNTISLIVATEVMNLTADHPAPYGVVFPGLE